jgi:hypothetical protein
MKAERVEEVILRSLGNASYSLQKKSKRPNSLLQKIYATKAVFTEATSGNNDPGLL